MGPRVGTWGLSLVMSGVKEEVAEVAANIHLLQVCSHGCCSGSNSVLQIFIST